MEDMKMDFPDLILHELHALHGKIEYSELKIMTMTHSQNCGTSFQA